MKYEHAQFSGSIPAAYDRDLRPMLFQPYADDLTARSLRHKAQRQSIIDVYTRMMIGTGAGSAYELLRRDKRAKVEAYGKQQRQRQR
jgi:hypothetical protein